MKHLISSRFKHLGYGRAPHTTVRSTKSPKLSSFRIPAHTEHLTNLKGNVLLGSGQDSKLVLPVPNLTRIPYSTALPQGKRELISERRIKDFHNWILFPLFFSDFIPARGFFCLLLCSHFFSLFEVPPERICPTRTTSQTFYFRQ